MMALAELDAALRAAMDEDWDHAGRRDGTPPPAAARPPSPPPISSLDDGALHEALRAAMDSDWEGTAPPPGLRGALAPAAADGQPASMGYLSLPAGWSAAALLAGCDAEMAEGFSTAARREEQEEMLLGDLVCVGSPCASASTSVRSRPEVEGAHLPTSVTDPHDSTTFM
ncbi:hypothetical protein AB1Y20_005052 [Prymnesium parvum]|uniref:Uncharacterized protein n=1 Tax=Prymnesium parvum TaxID=97485 RepID=A0AB34J482_PRYPA